MEKQEKQLKIITEELKTIQAQHEQLVIKSKKRLQLKDAANKVLEAVRIRNTESVVGGDMARLIKAMETDDLFKNKKAVGKVI